MARIIFLAAALSLALAGCMELPKGLLEEGPTSHIAEVTVTKNPNTEGSVNMAEDLRVKIHNRAYLLSETGAPKRLEVHIRGVSLRSRAGSIATGVVRALLVGPGTGREDWSRLAGSFKVYDVESGALDGEVSFGALAQPAGTFLEGERALNTAAAYHVLSRIFGYERVAQIRNLAPPSRVTPNFPADDAELARQSRCGRIARSRRDAVLQADMPQNARREAPIPDWPAECADFAEKEEEAAGS